jgi:hypothetical protein
MSSYDRKRCEENARRRADSCREIDDEMKCERKKEKAEKEKEKERRCMKRLIKKVTFERELSALPCLDSTIRYLEERRKYWEFRYAGRRSIFGILAGKQDTRYLQFFQDALITESRDAGQTLLAYALEESVCITKALREGHVDVTKFYLERGLQADTIVNKREETHAYTPEGRKIIVRQGLTAIRAAIEGGSIDTLDLLLEANSLSGKNIMEVLQIGSEARPDGKSIPIVSAVGKGNLDILARLYLTGANLHGYAYHAAGTMNSATLNYLVNLGVVDDEEMRYVNENSHFYIRKMMRREEMCDENVAKDPEANLAFLRRYIPYCNAAHLASLAKSASKHARNYVLRLLPADEVTP